MTGAQLAELRWSLVEDSSARLARLLGIHERTIQRGVHRRWVTPYVLRAIYTTPIAAAHWRGMRRGAIERQMEAQTR